MAGRFSKARIKTNKQTSVACFQKGSHDSVTPPLSGAADSVYAHRQFGDGDCLESLCVRMDFFVRLAWDTQYSLGKRFAHN